MIDYWHEETDLFLYWCKTLTIYFILQEKKIQKANKDSKSIYFLGVSLLKK